jgi:hypothetical protein
MKTIYVMATATAIALSAVSFIATPAAARLTTAGSSAPPEHYCLSYEAGTDCGFTSYAQCEATASGIGGTCTVQEARNGGHPAHG